MVSSGLLKQTNKKDKKNIMRRRRVTVIFVTVDKASQKSVHTKDVSPYL